MDELREQIWDYLFQVRSQRSIDDLASWSGRDPADVRAAVQHPWFRVTDDKVAVAYDVG